MIKILLYIFVMAGVTYLIRTLPILLVKKKIKNRFVLSFLHYIPYAVLSVMTIPACFYATGNIYTAVAGITVALVLALCKRSLVVVAAGAAVGVFLAEMFISYIFPL